MKMGMNKGMGQYHLKATNRALFYLLIDGENVGKSTSYHKKSRV